MIRKEIQFKNYADETEKGVFYFNMSKGELVMQQMSAIDQHTESFQDKLEKIGKNLQGKALVETLKEIIEEAYGEKTVDGKQFVKVRNGIKLVENFLSSGAYSELIVELLSSAQGMADFINGLMPSDLRDQVNQEVNRQQAARDRSQANLQGYQKKQTPEVKPTPVVAEPELPTVIEETADPVFVDPEQAEFEAWKASQKQPAQQN
jgi:DNA helicase HerA-like ATPase